MTNIENAVVLAYHSLSSPVDPWTCDTAVLAMRSYITTSRMNQEGTWGTEKEIFAAASLFQLTINVSVLSPTNERSWHVFKPLVSNNTCLEQSNVNLYLFHTNKRNHYD